MAIKRTKSIESQLSKIEDVKILLEDLRDSRQNSFDNKSEKWQESEKGDEEQENISELENIIDAAESLCNDLENLFE